MQNTIELFWYLRGSIIDLQGYVSTFPVLPTPSFHLKFPKASFPWTVKSGGMVPHLECTKRILILTANIKQLRLLPLFTYETTATITDCGIQVSLPVDSKAGSSLSLTTILLFTGAYTHFSITHCSFTYKLNLNCKWTSYCCFPDTRSLALCQLSPRLMRLLLPLPSPQQWSYLSHFTYPRDTISILLLL